MIPERLELFPGLVSSDSLLLSYMLSHCNGGLAAYQCVTQIFIKPLIFVLLESLIS